MNRTVGPPLLDRRTRRDLLVVAVVVASLTVAALTLLWRLTSRTGDYGLGFLVFFVGFGACALIYLVYGAIALQLRRLELEVEQLRALVNVRPLTATMPIRFGKWSVDPIFAEAIVHTLMESRPRLVVECGSGWSTVLIATCLRHLGNGRLVTLEHDERFARQTRDLLQRFGVADLVHVVTAPLGPWTVNGSAVTWYRGFSANDLVGGIDVLLVDGPPKDTSLRARYPAIPLLQRHLAADCVILLDDGDRPDERWTAHQWSREIGGQLEYIAGAKGGWLIRRSGTRLETDGTQDIGAVGSGGRSAA